MAVETTSSLPSALTTSHAQPEPKRVVAAAVKASWKASNEPKASLIAAATSAVGSCFSGDKSSQKSAWLRCPPPLLISAWRISAGIFSTSAKSASRSSPISGCFSSAALAFAT